MRRFLNGLVGYPASLSRTLAQGWDQFVFRPADPTPLGLIRVLVGLLLTSLISSGLKINGATTWLLATLIVWVAALIAGLILPLLLVKRAVTERRGR